MPRRNSQTSRQTSQSRTPGQRPVGESSSDNTGSFASQRDTQRIRETNSESSQQPADPNARSLRTPRQTSDRPQNDEQNERTPQPPERSGSDHSPRLQTTEETPQTTPVAENIPSDTPQTPQTRAGGSTSNQSQQPASQKDSTTAPRGNDPSDRSQQLENPENQGSTSREQRDADFPMKPDNDADEFEDVLRHVGDLGRYQRLLMLLLMPFGIFYAYVYFVQMFITLTPQKHWCAIPELAHLDSDIRRNLSAPVLKSGKFDKCKTFDVNWTEVLMSMTPPPANTPTVPCKHGWDFDFTDIPYPTVVTERGWVCDKAGNVPLAQFIFFVGAIVGGLFFGWLADRYGRVPALVGSNLMGGIGGIATIFTSSVWDFVLCRFIVGMAFDNCFMMGYILVLEYVSPCHRTCVANLTMAMYFGSGCLSLPWLALWINDWKKLLWVTAAPMLLAIFTIPILPESARWYVSRGRVASAVSVLRTFEKVNRTKIPDDVMNDFIVASNQTKDTDETFLDLVRSSALRVTMLLMLFVYMACALIFDGLVRLSDAFGLDFFITFTVTSSTEIPSVLILVSLLDKLGRRKMAAAPMCMAGVLTLVAMFVPKGIPQAGLAIFSRFCINIASNAVVQWATELLPTAVRASGSAAMHISGYVSALLSPYIVYSERLWTLLPLLIIGTISVAGGGANVGLPETKGMAMPQTMADSARIVREKSLFGKGKNLKMFKWKYKREKALIT